MRDHKNTCAQHIQIVWQQYRARMVAQAQRERENIIALTLRMQSRWRAKIGQRLFKLVQQEQERVRMQELEGATETVQRAVRGRLARNKHAALSRMRLAKLVEVRKQAAMLHRLKKQSEQRGEALVSQEVHQLQNGRRVTVKMHRDAKRPNELRTRDGTAVCTS